MDLQSCFALILAAGKGTRMGAGKPKVLRKLLGSPMLAFVIAALEPLFQHKLLTVSGHLAEILETTFPEQKFIRQTEQLGTGHALITALPALRKANATHALVVNGDVPLLTSAVIASFMEKATGADIAFATITLSNPGAYGRIVRKDGEVTAIVEAKDYDSALHGEPTGEVNAGLYLLDLEQIAGLLPGLGANNKSGEYYLTDLIGMGLDAGLIVRAICCGQDQSLLGINSPIELAEAENLLAERTVQNLLASGVILHNPQSLRISPLARIDPGAEISGPCEIYGASLLSAGTEAGPYNVIIDSVLESGSRVQPFSHLDSAHVGPDCIVGPYARLRPGSKLESGAHVGNFVELKKTTLGRNAKANHLSYLGDSEIGAGTNIGAGTITCNYDGKNKFPTRIGEQAFIGSNTALVAPVEIGDEALVGAGSVITQDVPPGALALGRARQINIIRKK